MAYMWLGGVCCGIMDIEEASILGVLVDGCGGGNDF